MDTTFTILFLAFMTLALAVRVVILARQVRRLKQGQDQLSRQSTQELQTGR